MTDNLIFTINLNKYIGQELADKLNGNYIISTIEVIYNSIVNKNDIINGFMVGDFYIHTLINYYYNNVMNFDVIPLLHTIYRFEQTTNFDKYNVFRIMSGNNININIDKLIIILKPISKKYYYSIDIVFTTINYQIYSDFFININEFENYINKNTNFDVNKIYNLFKKLCNQNNNRIIYIYETLNSHNNSVLIGDLNDI